ncbi:MAG: aminoacyl-tRNA hydrolase [Rhodospirillaceae bacterium]|nr:aminoacyl-tRNA hydrolase [Rhodospirillaceae bacterium]
MLLLVGLGNPGPRYAGNRHNLGFLVVEALARRYGFGPARARFHGLVREGEIAGERVLALKPETYMNDSGLAVAEAVRFYKLAPGQVVVIHDEIELVPGKVRVKRGGGAGGHNGLRSVDAHIGPDYWRVRLGIGHPGHPDLVRHYVLQDFAKDERPLFEKLVEAVVEAFPRLVTALAAGKDGNDFMNRVTVAMAPPRPKRPRPEGAEGSGPPGARDPRKDEE